MARRDLQALLLADERDGEQEVNPFAMAMQLLGMQQQRRQQQEERGFEREKLGLEEARALREEQRAAEALGLQTRQQTEAELTGRTGREIAAAQEKRAIDVAAAAAEQQKFANQLAERKLIVEALDKVAGVQQLSPEVQAMLEQLPGTSDALGKVRGRQDLARTLPELQLAYTEPDAAKRDAAIAAVYGKMSPYSRENAPWQDLNALIKPDVSRPTGATPTSVSVGKQLMSPEGVRISDILAPRVTVDPELRSGRTRPTPQTQPTQQAIPPEFRYEEGYPSAQPNYMYGIQTPDSSEIINRYEADPRFKTAEQQVLEWIKNLFGGGNTEQIEAVSPEEFVNAPPEFTYEEGYPSAMPPEMSLFERAGLNARMNLGRQRAGGGPRPNVDELMSFLNQPRARIGE